MNQVKKELSVVKITNGYFVHYTRYFPDKQIQHRMMIVNGSVNYDASEEFAKQEITPILPPDRDSLKQALRIQAPTREITMQDYQDILTAIDTTLMGREEGLSKICTGCKRK